MCLCSVTSYSATAWIPTKGSKPPLLDCGYILHPLSLEGSPKKKRGRYQKYWFCEKLAKIFSDVKNRM